MQNTFRLAHTTELAGPFGSQVAIALKKHLTNPNSIRTFLASGGKLKGIVKGKTLLGLCAFVEVEPGAIVINKIWTATRLRESREFKEHFGASPAHYLMGDFIRNGVVRFHHTGTTPLGAQFLSRLKRNNVVVETSHGLAATSHATQKARVLKPLRSLH
jgi:hypothetical protein